MGLGVSFRIAPGVRVRASSRGIRASVGPRAARAHVGAGRTRISTGAGPVTLSTTLGGSGRRRAPSGPSTRSRQSSAQSSWSSTPSSSTPVARTRQPTVAQLQAQARAAERAQEVAGVAALENSLTTLHQAAFADSARQVLTPPPAPGRAEIEAVRRELYRTATTSVPLWRLAQRRQAKEWAGQQAPVEAERRHTGDLVGVQWEQSQLDLHWQALCDHDQHTVIEAVDDAFADNASDSTCVDAGTVAETGARYVTAVVTYAGLELMPEHRADRTPGGKPTLRKRTKTDRNALYATSIASTVLATAKEALAVAVAATEARVLVVRPDGMGDVEPVYAGTLRRDHLAHLDWATIDPLAVAMEAEDAQMSRKGSTREVVALAVEANSPAAALLGAWSQPVDEDS
ncbi:DUF4236 domain-containing protein [Terrabacter sp. NPDC080008]|uniref:DUF4236 domain-containing protein n=1 Tax=Terrabacter sp. NPDC080008 TaxID=3155176 RepID=UPI00344B4FC4